MFRHLDDPSPPEAGTTARNAVLRRAAYHRRQRVLTAAIASLALVVGGLAGALVARGQTSVNLTTVQTGYQFNQQPDPLPLGTPVPTSALAEVIFADGQHGYAVAIHRDRALLVATSDGGNDWNVVSPSLPPGFSSGGTFVGQFEFTSVEHGYLWGGSPSAGGAAPLWVTNDGGQTWHAAQPGPTVYDVSAIGDNVWVIAGGCNASGAAPPCPAGVEISFDDGTTWHPATPPDALSATGPGHTYNYELARITRGRSYVLTETTPATSIALSYTDDGGTTWVSRSVPCSASVALGAELAASSTDDLWLLCGGQGTAGYQPKQLFRSADGGLHWQLVSSATGFFGTPAATTNSANPLPAAGYVAPISIGHKNLAVASPTTAWLFPSRGVVYETTDGGYTWLPVPNLRPAGFGTGAPGNLTFLNANDGWVCELGVGVWQTKDGTHWSALGV